MIREAMARTDVTAPARVLVAGDTVLDVRAGRTAGAGFVVAVRNGAQASEELRAEGPTHLLGGVADLPALLGVATDTHR
jgi:phosphoglycolate phosphatase